MSLVFNAKVNLAPFLEPIPNYLGRPARVLGSYHREHLRPDLIAGITTALISLPQAIAFALLAELPAEMGLYAAIMGGVFGALWGSSNQNLTAPSNAISVLVLSVLLGVTQPGSAQFLVAAGLLAVMAGIFQLLLGLARLGALVNFVSHSVIVGFAGGAGILIAMGQLRHLLGLTFDSANVLQTAGGLLTNLADTHPATAALGVGTIAAIVILRRTRPKLPGALAAMVLTAGFVLLLDLEQQGVAVIGEVPRGLPPLARLPLLDLDLISRLSTGALALGAIGLVQTTAIARSIAGATGQRLDSNQEFVGQGLANIMAGFFSGFPVAGSFSGSAVSVRAGARSPLAAALAGLFILVALFTLAPLAATLPRAALAGALIVTAYGMVDRAEMARIWRGGQGDAAIMVVTLLGTIFLEIEFAVLAGLLLSFALYIIRTSTPRVFAVLPDDDFRHFIHQPEKPPCPQLAIIELWGDLYFGAVHHVEKAVHEHMTGHPEQRFLLLRMHNVNQCDFSGIHMLESVVHSYREHGGDVFVVQTRKSIMELMRATGFCAMLGEDHFLPQDRAISHLFYHVLDPAVCIYECPTRAFKECQNLPKREYGGELPLTTERPTVSVADIEPRELWQKLRDPGRRLLVVDVREPREFARGHIPQAALMPLPELLANVGNLPHDRPLVLVCRSGRRSHRAGCMLQERGFDNIVTLRGGMLAWDAAGLLEAVET